MRAPGASQAPAKTAAIAITHAGSNAADTHMHACMHACMHERTGQYCRSSSRRAGQCDTAAISAGPSTALHACSERGLTAVVGRQAGRGRGEGRAGQTAAAAVVGATPASSPAPAVLASRASRQAGNRGSDGRRPKHSLSNPHPPNPATQQRHGFNPPGGRGARGGDSAPPAVAGLRSC